MKMYETVFDRFEILIEETKLREWTKKKLIKKFDSAHRSFETAKENLNRFNMKYKTLNSTKKSKIKFSLNQRECWKKINK